MTPEEVELLRDLTIVIPTYNRPLELERAIEYWRDTPITVHILDGSQSPSFALGKLLGIPTITYHHFPTTENDLLYGNYYKRLKFALTLPKTKYSALIGEDDFFTISGLCECLRILSSEKGLCSVSGQFLGFGISSGVSKWGLRNYRSQNVKVFESRILNERLKALKTSGAPSLYYSIFETECWKKTFKFSIEHDFKNNVIGGEKLINSVAVALGPTKLISQIYCFRRYTTERINLEFSTEPRGEYDRYLSDDSNRIEIDAYYGALAKAIVSTSPSTSLEKALQLSKMVLAPNFYNSQSGREYQLRRKMARFMVAVGRVVPKNIRLLINVALATKVTKSLGFADIQEDLKPAHTQQPLSDLLIYLKDRGIVFEVLEIEGFEKLLLKPREELRLHANL